MFPLVKSDFGGQDQTEQNGRNNGELVRNW